MTIVRHTETVEASPDEVWRVVADARNLPRWNRLIHSVHGAPDRTLEKGDGYRTEIRGAGVTLQVRAEVLNIEAPRYAEIRLTGPLEATIRTYLRPLARGTRTRLEQEVDYRFKGGPLGELVARAVRRFGAQTLLRRGVRAQKRQVERG